MSEAPVNTVIPRFSTLAVAALFLALGLVGIANHEMWRDELEIWLIARDSGSLSQLFDNMSTQGHPAVWYLLNFAMTRFTTNPLAMQLLNLAVGTSTAVLFFRRAPFTTAQRLLFCFGYFALYEFTVISRSYALALLLAFVFCALFRRRRRLDPTGASILFVLANTTLYGAVVASHIVLLVVLQAFLDRRPERLWRERKALLALAVVLLGVAIGFGHTWVQGQAMGPAHTGSYTPEHNLTWIAACLSTVYQGAVPLPDLTQFRFWNTNLLQLLPGSSGVYVGAVLAMVLVPLAAYGLRGKPALSIIFVLGTATMLSITFFVWYGWVRHHGQVFLWYLVCCWLWYGMRTGGSADGDTPSPWGRPAGVVLTTVLALQTLAGAHAYVTDLMQPFSNAKAVGLHLRQQEFEDVILVGSIDYAIQPVAAYLDRRFYYPESGEFRTFVDWGPSRRLVPPEVVLQESLKLLNEDDRDVVIVFNYQPGTMEPGQLARFGSDARLRCFARFTGALVPEENYHLCRAFSTDRDSPPSDVDSPNGRTDNYDRDTQED